MYVVGRPLETMVVGGCWRRRFYRWWWEEAALDTAGGWVHQRRKWIQEVGGPIIGGVARGSDCVCRLWEEVNELALD